MRGRTLNDAFVILDEAQNTTPEQMKMFLTRLGFGGKAVDHRRHRRRPTCRAACARGLRDALELLERHPRHRRCAASPTPTSCATRWSPTIVRAYDARDRARADEREPPGGEW